jgi:hypothetical protein
MTRIVENRALALASLAAIGLVTVACGSGLVAGTRAASDARASEAKACLELPKGERGACLANLTPFETLEDSAYECFYRTGVVVHPTRFMGSAEGLAIVAETPRDVVAAEALRADGVEAMVRTLSNGSYTRGCMEPGLAAVSWWLDADREQPKPTPTPESEREKARVAGEKALDHVEEATREERARYTEEVRKAAEARVEAQKARTSAVRERLVPVVRACGESGAQSDARCDTLGDLTDGERVGCRRACSTAGLLTKLKLASNDCKASWRETSTQCDGLTGDELTRCTSACASGAKADREATFRFAEDACVELPKGKPASCMPSHVGTSYDLKAVAQEIGECVTRCKSRRGERATSLRRPGGRVTNPR